MSARDRGLDARVRSRFRRFGVSASDVQVDQCCAYIGLLAKWNNTVNLTALGLAPVSSEAVDRLLVEPMLAAGFLERYGYRGSTASHGGVITLVDVGSGGGSPAIPLKIAIPAARLLMVEAKARKSAFLREVARRLALDDVEVRNCRLEGLLASPELHESADLISLRAVRADQALWKSLSAFAKPGGRVLWFRTRGDMDRDVVFFPSFLLESVEPLIPARGSELAVLRRPGRA